MKTDKTDERRDQFKQLLFLLAKSQSLLSSASERRDIYLKLEKIYSSDDEIGDFRHFYSDIFAVLSLIENDISLGNIEILNQNMELLRKGYNSVNCGQDGKTITIEKQINKLYDHINLEIARINYFRAIESKSRDRLDSVTQTLTKVEDNIEKVEKTIDKVDDIQKQYITILGIFASIVLAFTGGIAFSTSILENIANASIYRTLLVVVALIFVLINVIYILTRFIMEISKTENTVIQYPKYMKILNIMCVVAVAIIIVSWIVGITKAVDVLQGHIY